MWKYWQRVQALGGQGVEGAVRAESVEPKAVGRLGRGTSQKCNVSPIEVTFHLLYTLVIIKERVASVFFSTAPQLNVLYIALSISSVLNPALFKSKTKTTKAAFFLACVFPFA